MTGQARHEPRLSNRDRAALVRLADGTLGTRRRARAEARVRALPDGARLVERQQRVRHALRAGLPPRPLRAEVAPVAVRPSRRRRVPRWGPAAGLAGAVAALVLALVLAQPRAGSIVAQAAELAQRPATAPAPASAGNVLRAEVDGVRFPDWSREFGWHETGSRADTLGGRRTKTVSYRHMGHRLAYTILPGRAVPAPDGSRVVRRDGLAIALSYDPRHGGSDSAVFERDGRTCVLAGHVERVSTLVKLAAWAGGGAVRPEANR
jgi:hypothetical protein